MNLDLSFNAWRMALSKSNSVAYSTADISYDEFVSIEKKRCEI